MYYSVREIADILGITTKGVRNRIERRKIKTKKFDTKKRCFVYTEEQKNLIMQEMKQNTPVGYTKRKKK